MGKVAVTLRLMPDGEVSLDQLKEEVRKYADIQKMEEKPIAFGIKALEITALISDSEGGTDKLENDISIINGVQSLEVIDIGLI